MSTTSPTNALSSASFADDSASEDVDSATFATGVDRGDDAANPMADLPPPVRSLVNLTSSGCGELAVIEQAFEEQPLVAESVLSQARALMSPHQACETIADVMAVLGPRTLGVLAAASVATGMLERGASAAQSARRAMTIAALCRRIAPIAGASADDAALSGLLFDVGETMLLRQKRGALVRLVDAGMSERERIERERAQLGFDHAALGESALRSWGANEDVALTVRYHHDAAGARGAGGRVTRLVEIVRFCAAVARRIADAKGSMAWSMDRVTRQESAAHLPLGAVATKDLCRAVRDAFVPYGVAGNSISVDGVALEEVALPCAVCDGPSSGTSCPCCDGNLCTEHETGHGWCLRCEANYRAEQGSPERVLFTAAGATAAILAGLIGTGRIRDDSFVRGISATALLACALATVAALCVRGVRRAGFRAAEKSMTREKTSDWQAETTLEKALSSGSRMFRATVEGIRSWWAEGIAAAISIREADGMRAAALVAEGKRDSKAMVMIGARHSTMGKGSRGRAKVSAKKSPSSVRKVRKAPAKTAKKTSTSGMKRVSLSNVKKAPAKPRAKRAKVARAS